MDFSNNLPTELENKEDRDRAYEATHPASWVWDEDVVSWVSPKAYPDDGFPYIWSEEELNWVPFPGYPRD
jgi:hypothetical protein